MVTSEQLVNGIIKFIDEEMMPQLPIAGKWVVGTYISILSIKQNQFISSILQHPFIQPLGLVDQNGIIDEQLLLSKLCLTAEKYGKLTVPVPMIGNINLTHEDVQKLKRIFSQYSIEQTNNTYIT